MKKLITIIISLFFLCSCHKDIYYHDRTNNGDVISPISVYECTEDSKHLYLILNNTDNTFTFYVENEFTIFGMYVYKSYPNHGVLLQHLKEIFVYPILYYTYKDGKETLSYNIPKDRRPVQFLHTDLESIEYYSTPEVCRKYWPFTFNRRFFIWKKNKLVQQLDGRPARVFKCKVHNSKNNRQ